jgi:hypothetical protein
MMVMVMICVFGIGGVLLFGRWEISTFGRLEEVEAETELERQQRHRHHINITLPSTTAPTLHIFLIAIHKSLIHFVLRLISQKN